MAQHQELILRPKRDTWRQRLAESLRSINPKDKAIARYFGGGTTLAGVSVNEDNALAISAVWSAVTMISDDIASLPLMLYKRLPNGGKDRFESHPLYRLLHDAPNPEMDSMVFRRVMQTHALIWQNAYAEIERDAANRPVAMWPLLPERTSVERRNGQLVYRYRNESGSDAWIPPADMIHLVGYSHDGSVGCSMVRYSRESFGLTLAAERYGAAHFGNGATPGGIVSVKGPRPNPQTEKEHRDQIEARHLGVERAHRLMVLYNEATFTQNAIPPNAGQFNETRIQQIREVARWFKMPPHKLGDLADATYSNVEQMDAAYLSSCIRPWLVLWQQQLSRKLIPKLEQRQQFIEHETHGFLSVDAASRAQLYTAEAHVGSITINEIRGYENRDPIPGGDRVFVQPGQIPLDRLDEWLDADIAAKKAKAEPPPVPQPPPANDAETKALREALDLARHATQLAEDAKDLATARYEATQHTLETVTAELEAERAAVAQLAGDVRAAAEDYTNEKLAREALTAERDTLRIQLDQRALELTQACVDLDALRDELQAASVALTAEREAVTAERDARTQAEADRDAAVALTLQTEQERDEARARVTTVSHERDEWQQRFEAVERQVGAAIEDFNAEKQARAQAESDRDAALALAAQTEQEREAIASQRDDARADVVELRAELLRQAEAYGLDLKAAEQSAEGQAHALSAMTAERDAAIARIADVEQERDIYKSEAVKLGESLGSANETNAGLLADRHALAVKIAGNEAEAETLKADLARARADLATELDKQRTHRTVMLAAMRSLFADATERLLQREVDRARNNKSTPEKLRAWVDRFYPLHAEMVRDTFRPLVGPWTAITGGAPSALLDRLVAEHIETSRNALEHVLMCEDDEDRAASLERVFKRWEEERGDQVADALVREGMGQ